MARQKIFIQLLDKRPRLQCLLCIERPYGALGFGRWRKCHGSQCRHWSRSVHWIARPIYPNRNPEFLYSMKMSKFLTSKKPGRPPRNLIDVLRTQLWFHVLKLSSGLPSAYAIEKALEPHLVRITADGVNRPRKWDSYEHGTRVPKRSHDLRDAVELAERHFPGTASWFDNPLWEILKGTKPDRWELQRLLQSLSPAVIDVLITTKGSINGQAELVQLTHEHFDCLVALGTFDALAAVAILTKLSEETASHELRDMALDCYARLQPILADAPETCVHYPELFTYVDNVCQYWLMVSPGKRMNVHVFWHGQEWAEDRISHFGPKLALLYRSHAWGKAWEEWENTT